MAMCKVFLDLSVAEIKVQPIEPMVGEIFHVTNSCCKKTIFSMLLWNVMNDLKEVSIIYM